MQITGSQIRDNTVTEADLDPAVQTKLNAVGTGGGGVADNSVTSAKIQDGEVTSADIQDGTITGTDITPGTIPIDDLDATLQALLHSTLGIGPISHGLGAWTEDPALATATLRPTSGTITYGLMRATKNYPAGASPGYYLNVSTAGSGLTSGQNSVALYLYDLPTGTATLISTGADQSTFWTTTGTKNFFFGTLSAPIPAGSYLLYGLLTTGTTAPTFRASTGSTVINTTTNTNFRRRATRTATTHAATLTPANLTLATACPWFALA